MDRRSFAKLLGLGAATIIVPQFGRFYREGHGKLWTQQHLTPLLPGEYLAELREIYINQLAPPGHGFMMNGKLVLNNWTDAQKAIGPVVKQPTRVIYNQLPGKSIGVTIFRVVGPGSLT